MMQEPEELKQQEVVSLIPQKSTVQVTVQQGIGLEDLQAMIGRIVTLSGCTGCGLLGFDLHILGGDPELFKSLRPIEGVQSARVVAEQAL